MSRKYANLSRKKKVWFSDTPAAVDRIDSLLEEIQRQGVHVERRGEVREYLLRFPELVDVLRKAVAASLDRLSGTHLSLEVYHDPEIEDEYLMLYVRSQKYDESLMRHIQEAEEEYLDLLQGQEGWLQLGTDFQEPEFA